MRILLIAPQLGFEQSGAVVPGGLLNFGRCVARVLASSPSVHQLGIWCQVDPAGTEHFIHDMLRVHAHSALLTDIRCYGGSEWRLAADVALASAIKTYDHIIYLLVNQSVLSVIPWHLPYSVWEIGGELFRPVSRLKYMALSHANRLLSISQTTNDYARQHNPGLPPARIIHLCLEPPLYEPESKDDPILKQSYEPAQRKLAIFILGNMQKVHLYKGHQQLIAGWAEVISQCSNAELWIGGEGDGHPELKALAQTLPALVAKHIHFLGRLNDTEVQRRFQDCRAFAMPSTGEGFGLVFVEAARYGLPCIGGKHDAVKEIVLHNQTGLLVEQEPHEVAQACITLLTKDSLAKQFGDAARQRYFSYFQYAHFRERLLQALEMVL